MKNLDLSENHVLAKNEYLTLETTCNLSQGGEVERVDLTTVHSEYFEIFKTIYLETGLNYVGADLITPDLTIPPKINNTAINELNCAPGPTIGVFADMTENQPYLSYRKLLAAIEADPPEFNTRLV